MASSEQRQPTSRLAFPEVVTMVHSGEALLYAMSHARDVEIRAHLDLRKTSARSAPDSDAPFIVHMFQDQAPREREDSAGRSVGPIGRSLRVRNLTVIAFKRRDDLCYTCQSSCSCCSMEQHQAHASSSCMSLMQLLFNVMEPIATTVTVAPNAYGTMACKWPGWVYVYTCERPALTACNLKQ